jgi:hypothetical protein
MINYKRLHFDFFGEFVASKALLSYSWIVFSWEKNCPSFSITIIFSKFRVETFCFCLLKKVYSSYEMIFVSLMHVRSIQLIFQRRAEILAPY